MGIDWVAIWMWIVTVGTNNSITQLFLNNILLFGLIAFITKSEKDNAVFDWLKNKISPPPKDKE